ncbi:hypothetical protein Ahy_A07g033689 [Arachis hypogaea]|uniref:Uncharacterized protein n=1 Tax=Arachis hypogaea TaxID=3818 RepID=A0A445C9V9_ARAHY|nr:hypothetical protein Ahy_A07g033689 [Arachis hypogaea]
MAYLANFQPSCWTKAHFSYWPKLDNVTNNMIEVWNAKINHYRGKSILTILEEIRCYLMRRMAKHKKVLSTYTRVLAPIQQRKMEDIMKDTKFWTAQWTGDNNRNRCDRPEPYVHPWLKMDAFRATYGHSNLLAPKPPTIKRPPGCPTKKKRKPNLIEDSPDVTKGKKNIHGYLPKMWSEWSQCKDMQGTTKV